MNGREALVALATALPFPLILSLPVLLIDCGGSVECAAWIVGSLGIGTGIGILFGAGLAALALSFVARRVGRSPLLLAAVGAAFGVALAIWITGEASLRTPLAMAGAVAGIVAGLVHLAVTVRPLRSAAEPLRSGT